MKLTIIYDNWVNSEHKELDLKKGWGFSCLIEKEENLLFDTGWRGNILVENMQKLGHEIENVNTVVISHQHWDHVGGLPCVLNQSSGVRVVVPKSLSRNMKREIMQIATASQASEPEKVTQGVYSTSELGERIKEQAIAVETGKGLLLITGCAHPGIENILETAEQLGDVYGIVGGFHGFDNFPVLEDLELIVPCHCTRYKEEIRKEYPEKTKEGGIGFSLEL